MNVCLCGAHTAGVRELGTFEGTQQPYQYADT